MGNKPLSDNTILAEALRTLEARLPPGWETDLLLDPRSADRRVDAIVTLRAPDGEEARFAVEVKARVEPAAVLQLKAHLAAVRDAVPVVVAPFLSARTRDLLKDEGIRFWDLTGNAWLTADRPALFIDSKGAEKDPAREERPARSLRGAKAGRVVRALCDSPPPFGVRRLAEVAGTDAGYVSRLLVLLEREALIEREPRGPVFSVDWSALIRRWTQDYRVLRSNRAVTFLDPRGVNAFVDKLRESQLEHAVTGSLGASKLAPVAPPALAMCYVEEPERVGEGLQLLPADAGINVMLLAPFDPVVYERSREDQGLMFAAASQIVADLLTGPGRGPAEADALLEWMTENEDAWRA